MTTRGIARSHLGIFDWVCEPKPTPTGVVHPRPLLAAVAGRGRHGCGSERLDRSRGNAIRKILKGESGHVVIHISATISFPRTRSPPLTANHHLLPFSLTSKCPSHPHRSHPTPCCFAGNSPSSPSVPSRGSQQVLIIRHSPVDLEGSH